MTVVYTTKQGNFTVHYEEGGLWIDEGKGLVSLYGVYSRTVPRLYTTKDRDDAIAHADAYETLPEGSAIQVLSHDVSVPQTTIVYSPPNAATPAPVSISNAVIKHELTAQEYAAQDKQRAAEAAATAAAIAGQGVTPPKKSGVSTPAGLGVSDPGATPSSEDKKITIVQYQPPQPQNSQPQGFDLSKIFTTKTIAITGAVIGAFILILALIFRGKK